jgi:transposase
MHGRHTALVITLTPGDRATLEAWGRSRTLPYVVMRRARLILLCADGLPIVHAAAQVGLTRRHAYVWLKRWQAEGLAGLQDRPSHDTQHMQAMREAKARKRRERTAS